jgi:hypothetical protein
VGLPVVSVSVALPYVIHICNILKEAVLIFLFFSVFHSYTLFKVPNVACEMNLLGS